MQVYCNSHAWLAAQLRAKGIDFELIDNAFVHIPDYTVAQPLAQQLKHHLACSSWLGTRLKHVTGPVSLKLYAKFGLILRLETTVNDVTFFKQHRLIGHGAIRGTHGRF